MKKLFLVAAFAFVSNVGFSQTVDEAFKKDVLKVIAVDGSNKEIDSVRESILKMVPSAKHAEFNADFDASIKKMNDSMAKLYMDTFTKEEVKNMLAYYESPMGKKIAEKKAGMTEKTMESMKEWMGEFQGVMMKYIQE